MEVYAAGSESIDIFSSSDSGQHWRKIATTPYANPAPGQLSFGGNKTGISFRDGQTGWATSYTDATDHPWLYVTHDGGLHWQYQTLPLVPGISNGFYGTTPPVMIGRYGLMPVTVGDDAHRGTLLYSTSDGGNNWVPLTLPKFVAQTVYVVDLQHIYATNGTACFASVDGGHSWQQRSTSTLPDLIELSFVDLQHGWTIGGSSSHENLLQTQDGGRTWQAINYVIS
jgi:photosystem II stability/assembly factor-like uncharacterized protein